MTASEIRAKAAAYVAQSPVNTITADIALAPDCIGLGIYDAPLFAFGDAADPLFARLKEKQAVGERFLSPTEWLDGAKTVISFFLPFTDAVRASNRRDMRDPSHEWLHARIQGQELVEQLAAYLVDELAATGCESVFPCGDPRFSTASYWEDLPDGHRMRRFTVAWSERHVAFVCGMGTFGLSQGLITEKGIAGRLGSVVTTLELPPTARRYDGLYDYCSQCLKCVRNCPVECISQARGKEHGPCSDLLDAVRARYRPYYGCGKCQVAVPCEQGIPNREFRM